MRVRGAGRKPAGVFRGVSVVAAWLLPVAALAGPLPINFYGPQCQARPPLPNAYNMLRNPKTGYVYVSHSTDADIDVLTCR